MNEWKERRRRGGGVKRKLQKSQIPPLKYIHTINRGVYSILISHCLSGCKKGKGESWLISTIAANWHFATTFNYITQELAKDSHLRRTRTHTHTERLRPTESPFHIDDDNNPFCGKGQWKVPENWIELNWSCAFSHWVVAFNRRQQPSGVCVDFNVLHLGLLLGSAPPLLPLPHPLPLLIPLFITVRFLGTFWHLAALTNSKRCKPLELLPACLPSFLPACRLLLKNISWLQGMRIYYVYYI